MSSSALLLALIRRWASGADPDRPASASFARALVANPQVLIRDEAGANNDSFAEFDSLRALKLLFKGWIRMVTAYRLATARDA